MVHAPTQVSVIFVTAQQDTREGIATKVITALISLCMQFIISNDLDFINGDMLEITATGLLSRFRSFFSENDPCHPDPCKNKGTCQLLPLNSYYCICPEGWTGTNCEQGAK